MSKLTCDCGHTIVDQTDFLPCKAELYPDQDLERVWSDPVDAAVAFLLLPGRKRGTWLRDHFGTGAPVDPPLADVVAHILENGRRAVRREVLECESCGKLWVQLHPGVNRYRGYRPDAPGETGILRSAAAPAPGG